MVTDGPSAPKYTEGTRAARRCYYDNWNLQYTFLKECGRVSFHFTFFKKAWVGWVRRFRKKGCPGAQDRSLSASGNCKKFCIARRFTSKDWDAVLGSSSFRRISESKPCREGKAQDEWACSRALLASGEPSLCLATRLRKCSQKH